MDEQIKKFIEENIELIEQKQWEQIYKKGFPNDFTETLLECGVNPLEQGLSYIPNNFLYESNIKEFTIPDTVTSIGGAAFYYCTSLTSITIGDSVTSIDDFAFAHCHSLEKIEIPANATGIGEWAFYDCKSLRRVEIPNSVEWISSSAFSGCNNLISVVIGNGIRSVNYAAFKECNNLTSIEYTGTIDQWAQIDFTYQYSNPLRYAKNLYVNGELVTEAKITSSTKINNGAFSDYASLTSVTIGNSVTAIGNHAFYNCSSLTNLMMSNSVTSIGDYSFCNCKSLTKITYLGTKKEAMKLGIGNRSKKRWREGSAISKIICTDGEILL